MTESDTRAPWQPIPGAERVPGAKHYWAAKHPIDAEGRQIQSEPRTGTNGRFYEGTILKPREDPDGYLIVNIKFDNGERKTVSVARTVLETHAGPCPPGMEACHGDGGRKDNRWPENIRWDDRIVNWQEALDTRLRNNPPRPKPTRTCPACGEEHRDRGRRCHECVVELGVRGAQLLAGGMSPEEAAGELEYYPLNLLTLAVKYGGLRFVIEDEINAALKAAGHRESRLRRVLFRREASRQNSDAQ